MRALGEQVQVEISHHRGERVRVLGLLNGVGPSDSQPVALAARDGASEQPVTQFAQRTEDLSVLAGEHLDGACAGLEHAHDGALAGVVHAKERERVRETPGQRLHGRRLDALDFRRVLRRVVHRVVSSSDWRRRSAT